MLQIKHHCHEPFEPQIKFNGFFSYLRFLLFFFFIIARWLLFFSLSRVLFFVPVTNITFAHIILSSLCPFSNVFCFFNYPKLFFRRERDLVAILNTWFALYSLTRDGIICFEAEQYQPCFKYCTHPSFSSLNSGKNMCGIFVYIRYIKKYVLIIINIYPSCQEMV